LQQLKNYALKTCGCGQPERHLIQVLNENNSYSGPVLLLSGEIWAKTWQQNSQKQPYLKIAL